MKRSWENQQVASAISKAKPHFRKIALVRVKKNIVNAVDLQSDGKNRNDHERVALT